MNQDFDKEIESILRRASRRTAQSPSGDASVMTGTPHMDADELSAYAEGALPDAARTRYMAHLADCDSCRKIVTELVVSQGIEQKEGGQVAQTVEARGRSFREWLAALFSPPVLRYAVPALALFAVIAVALIVATRSSKEPSFVAQNEPDKQQAGRPSEDVSKANANTTSTGTTAASEDNHESSSTANSNSAVPNPVAPPASLREASPAETSAPEGTAGPPSVPKTADLSTDERKPVLNEQQRAADSKRAEPPAPNNAPVDSVDRMKEKDYGALAAQRKQESADTAGGAAAGAAGGRRARGAEPNASTATTNSTSEITSEERQKNQAASKAPSALGRSTRRDSTGDDENAIVATRTVAGKRFRQQNGVWIETSYNSSRSVTKVRRDSEQYRALVADEPVIGTVANTLGNVIVVVKGRAYHVY